MKKQVSLLIYILFGLTMIHAHAQIKIYVSNKGNDNATGDINHPVASFERAQNIAQKSKPTVSVQVIFKNGTYYLPNTIHFTEKDSKIAKATITYCAENEGGAVISGGAQLKVNWALYKNGIYVTDVLPGTKIDQLYINGERQPMARHPNAQIGKNVFDSWD